MKYANIAIDAPVDNTFDYQIPPELEGEIEPGHLVAVPFGTAMQHGIVLSLHDDSPIEKTKRIHSRLDPRPLVTLEQIEIARWISRTMLSPLGPCVWLWLPPGLTGHQDIEIELIDADAEQNGKPVVATELESELVALLKRRGTLRGAQLNQALTGKNWRGAVDGLAKAGVLRKQPILTPPRVRPKLVQTASLAVHPNEIEPLVRRELAQKSLTADLLETVSTSVSTSGTLDAKTALKISGAKPPHLDALVSDGVLIRDGDNVSLNIPPDEVQPHLDTLRKLEKPLRILNVLAREGEALDVSWLYAQTDATLSDLKKLEEAGLVLLGEKQQWRDSMEERRFVSKSAPTLTPEQKSAWETIRVAIYAITPTPPPPFRGENRRTSVKMPPPPAPPRWGGGENETPPPAPPRIQGGEKDRRLRNMSENYRAWSVPLDLYRKLKPLTRELRLKPTPAEAHLWESVRDSQLGVRIRRQHQIERFVVDFYCRDAQLVIEVDGGIHQYTQEEDAIRQAYLENLGLRVVRFTNEQVMQALLTVIERLRTVIDEQKSRLAQESRLTPLPEFGEGLGVGSTLPNTESGVGASLPTGASSTFLLHGVTGSGKTEIYLRAIDLTLQLGKQALFLVPEIALTPQTVRRVAARFPGKVAVVHSGLSEGERYDTWRRSRDGLIPVIVGARSALFTPLPDVGLIILDEMHDSSYKQSPPIHPIYDARQVAEEMVKRGGAVLLLGSATPDVESAYRAERGEIRKLELPRRIMGHRVSIYEQAEQAGVLPRYRDANIAASGDANADSTDAVMIDLPPVRVVDMRDELKAGNTSIFSRPLQEALGDVLARKEQAILFLNRRGQATYVFCRDCGYVATCPRCDTPLTHHRAGDVLRCHRCGFQQNEPVNCPDCGSRRIKYFGAGTQQVESALTELFPRVRAARWDADTADSPAAHEAILQRFIERKTDVMIGTQMVAKGLDLPLVTLVGVVSADVGLNLPDFRAGERTFQLLTQVAGRAGRGLLGGQVILQTYRPEHYAIASASQHDFKGFYAKEIAYRREMGYPPFRRLVRILFRFPSETQAQAEAERAAGMLHNRLKALNMTATELIGPAPCFFTRENKQFRWHVILRGPDPAAALRGVNLPKGWHVDVDPVDVL